MWCSFLSIIEKVDILYTTCTQWAILDCLCPLWLMYKSFKEFLHTWLKCSPHQDSVLYSCSYYYITCIYYHFKVNHTNINRPVPLQTKKWLIQKESYGRYLERLAVGQHLHLTEMNMNGTTRQWYVCIYHHWSILWNLTLGFVVASREVHMVFMLLLISVRVVIKIPFRGFALNLRWFWFIT